MYDAWRREDFSHPAFPEIARRALEESNPSGSVDLTALIRRFLLKDDQPFQSVSGFGQPELIVHDNPRFYIQLLFWLDGTTDIHQHGFSGAFHVLAGSSIHSRFEFQGVRAVTAHFRMGELKLRKAEILEAGRTVPIHPGPDCIHALFHLDTPSVTAVIRTHGDPGSGPQFTYLPPHLAIDPTRGDALTLRRKQLLDVLEQTGDPSYPGLVRAMVLSLDFERGFFILQNCIGHLRELGAWENVWKAFVARHGKQALPVLPTLREIIRRDALVAMRASVGDPGHRFFLALLLNLRERGKILRFIRSRYPGPPVRTILGWAAGLVRYSPDGVSLLDAPFPSAVPVDGEEQELILLEALEHFLTGSLPKGSPLRSLGGRDRTLLEGAFASSSWSVLKKQ